MALPGLQQRLQRLVSGTEHGIIVDPMWASTSNVPSFQKSPRNASPAASRKRPGPQVPSSSVRAVAADEPNSVSLSPEIVPVPRNTKRGSSISKEESGTTQALSNPVDVLPDRPSFAHLLVPPTPVSKTAVASPGQSFGYAVMGDTPHSNLGPPQQPNLQPPPSREKPVQASVPFQANFLLLSEAVTLPSSPPRTPREAMPPLRSQAPRMRSPVRTARPASNTTTGGSFPPSPSALTPSLLSGRPTGLPEWDEWIGKQHGCLRDAQKKNDKKAPSRHFTSNMAWVMCTEGGFTGRPRLAPSPRFQAVESFPAAKKVHYPCTGGSLPRSPRPGGRVEANAFSPD